ncbi:DENN domain-containing protein 2A-like [Uloborus diversus]|uniref:DENN domain-containing protein 2A-like n=1 Tax=Uloborus diversus TaxID=327109 RepID=UPI00240A80C2|nr:DENN domain-containing protein 2A-like [Uloborus diversus]
MDNRNSKELTTSRSQRKMSEQESLKNFKVDIKEIRKKFETLNPESDKSTVVKRFSASYVPEAPLRKNRAENLSLKGNKFAKTERVSETKKEISMSSHSKILKNNSEPISVKEKTKLFESNGNDTDDAPNKEPVKNFFDTKTLVSRDSFSNINSDHKDIAILLSKAAKDDPQFNKHTPPAKPPRSFNHSSVKQESLSNVSNSNSPFSNDIKTKGKDKMSVRNDDKCLQSVKKTDSSNKTPVKVLTSTTPQSQRVSKKAQGIVNYLRNISTTANNICDKVKQKNPKIFVDLTPTTTSPPKRYGTLKRSLSEEHIYAEPASILKVDTGQKSPENKALEQPLHYMCTPIIKAYPNEEKTAKNKLSSLSMRNMIYESFSSLRVQAKDSQDSSTENGPDGSDSEISMKAIQDRIIYVKSVRKQISASSMCLSPKLFEALFIINISENQPEITSSFPSKIPELYNYPLLPHICFPDDQLYNCTNVYQSEIFDFSLLDKEEKVFGYCLRILGWPSNSLGKNPLCVKLPVAICILSSFSASVFYKKVLSEIEKHLTLRREKFYKYLTSLRKLGVPNAGASLSIPDYTESEIEERVVISRALDSHIVGFELTRALQLLDVDILVKSVASLLLERRLLLVSSSSCNLYQCCKAISSLLYPFEWPHLIIPVLPACLIVYCCSELPYILGISSNNINAVLDLLVEQELLVIDVDKGMIMKSYNDEETILPRKAQKGVHTALNLAKNMTDPTEMLRDIMISEAFVHMYVEMLGHYENHYGELNGDPVFNKEGFLKNGCTQNIRSFLQWFSETQMFDTFLEESKWRMKYRNICQTQIRTFFEKRIDEYKWELSHENEKLSKIIGKTVKNLDSIALKTRISVPKI